MPNDPDKTTPAGNAAGQGTRYDRLGRAARLAVILLALSALLFWLLHIPERPDRVFRAMPANSLMVSEHIDLAGVWRERLDNPLLVGTLAGAGVRHAGEWAADTNLVWIVRLVSGPRTLIGWSPALGPAGRPCWTAASWVGMRGRLLGLMLMARRVPGAGRLRTSAAGTPYMPMKSRKMRGLCLAFALRENVLMATLGEDPDAVRVLEERLARDAPPAPLFAGDPEPWRHSGAMPHRAWLHPWLLPFPVPGDSPIELGLTTIRPDRLEIAARTAPFGSGHAGEAAPVLTGRCEAADALAGGGVSAMLMLPHAALQEMLRRRLPEVTLPAPPPGAAPADDVCLCFSAPPCGGRLFNLAVPALTLLLPWPDERHEEAVPELVARLNAALGLKLRARPPEPPAAGRVLVDWLPGNRRLRLLAGNDNCLAAESRPGWLIICSSPAGLDARHAAPATENPPWRTALRTRLNAAPPRAGLNGFAWVDLTATAAELRKLLAVCRLAAAMGALHLDDETATRLRALEEALDSLGPLGTLEGAWHRDDENRLLVELALAPPANH